ncbi:MAG: haloacid dehalogenase type II [Chloroflexi bacterium]|nr:haloacid dehalogenase type II [Chloroflexota bacterium]
MSTDISKVKALTFDVFGTVVDWRSSITQEGTSLGAEKGVEADWTRFADAWRGGYEPAMRRVRTGEHPWTKIDVLHRAILDGLLDEYGLSHLTEDEKDDLNRVWHRLDPWPDAIAGLERMKGGFVIAALSNGNMSMLTNMAKNAGLPWDCILSAELARHYKPDPEVYQTAADLLGLRPDQVMMVAAHGHDLEGARAAGLRTAFVHRPLEFGPDRTIEMPALDTFDLTATDLLDLAAQLGT